MMLQDERERFLAETLAAVRYLSDLPVVASPSVAYEPDPRDVQHAMRARFEAFRNRRRLLEIEQEVHYQRAMQRIRIATDELS